MALSLYSHFLTQKVESALHRPSSRERWNRATSKCVCVLVHSLTDPNVKQDFHPPPQRINV